MWAYAELLKIDRGISECYGNLLLSLWKANILIRTPSPERTHIN